MSNHIHLDLTDPLALISKFRRDFKSLLARALNRHYGRWEYFWSPNDGKQEVFSEEAALRGMAYTMTNPVAAGLVAGGEAWPGLLTLPKHLGATPETCATLQFSKPAFFFRREKNGGLPDAVALTLAPHPLAKSPSFLKRLRKRVAKIEADKQAEMKRAAQRFKGVAAIEAQHHEDIPSTEREANDLNPRFAEPDPELRKQILSRYRAWLAEYTEARAKWLETGHAIFPAGTNKLRNYPGVTLKGG